MDLLRVVLPNGASWTILRPWLKPNPVSPAKKDSWERAEPQMVTVYLRKDPYERRADYVSCVCTCSEGSQKALNFPEEALAHTDKRYEPMLVVLLFDARRGR
ncbi:hypothetical protein F1559_003280 [Cyanidiococcus yangmingshanensis]|uniref:Uncharacterized protein n=1 Tax=Cyanidiococcus yangmingshanensis TaxID=2690220 RepID=A0A7J7IGU4_9RHOD|nr:hypothetical protein F1559_003280 [Cyanidiococcus yangmingshanensis]